MPSDVLISERISAAFLGTAVGDALGDPTEFLSTREALESICGRRGIRRLVGRPPQFTDDTQMALFTAEALVIAAYGDGADIDDPATHELLLRRSLEAQLRWRATQGSDSRDAYGPIWTGLVYDADSLWREERMHRVKAPGTTCLGALAEQHLRYREQGPITFASNDSKGCGGVMRSAPYGMLLQDPWWIACEAARLTHGHTLGWMSAGAYAQIVRSLVSREEGADVRAVVRVAIDESVRRARAEAPEAAGELEAILVAALTASETRPDTADLVDCIPARLGQGWVGEEALAIGLWCALAFSDPEDALAASASHRGDTDSTAAITGCLLGLIHGNVDVFGAYEPQQIEAIEVVERIGAVLNTLRFRRSHGGANLPVPRSWWIEEGWVLGGRFAADTTEELSRERLDALRFAGVRLIVNLQQPGEIGQGGTPFPDYEPMLVEICAPHDHEMHVHRMPIPDMGTPPDEVAVTRTLDLIDETIADGGKVYVHCWGGHGRTGTIAGCLLRRRGLDADAAFRRIAAARSHDAHLASYPSPQTEAQRAFVASWSDAHVDVERASEGEPAWIHGEPIFEIVPRIDDAAHRRALRVMRMLQRLHAAGYQRLRAFMFLSPSGGYWRCWIAPRELFLPNGWQIDPDVDWEDSTQIAAYTTGMDNEYFGWRDAASDSADDLAIKFIERFPEIARSGQGLDLEYAGWFALAVGSVERGDLPIFLADWAGPYESKLPAPPVNGSVTAERQAIAHGPDSSDVAVDELEISLRAYNALLRNGIDTIGALRSFLGSRSLSELPNVGVKVEREILDALDAWQPAGSEPEARPVSTSAMSPVTVSSLAPLESLRVMVDGLSERQRDILERRLIPESPLVTLQQIGDELGVTRERVRQLEQQTRDALESALRSDEHAALRECVDEIRAHAPLVHAEELDLDELCGTDNAATEHVLGQMLVLANAERASSWVHWGELGDLRARLNEMVDEHPGFTVEQIAVALSAVESISTNTASRLVDEMFDAIEIDSARYPIRHNPTYELVAVTALAAARRPVEFDELTRIAESVRDVAERSMRNALFTSALLARSGKSAWVLAKDAGDAEYRSISDEIEVRLLAAGPNAELRVSDLADAIAADRGVSPSSVRMYAAMDTRFHRTRNGCVRLRSDDDPQAFVDAATEDELLARPDVILHEGRPALQIEVTAETMRGSGRPLSTVVARYLRMQPGGMREFEIDGHSLTLSWRSPQPGLGSMRSIAKSLGAAIGDTLLLRFESHDELSIIHATGHDDEPREIEAADTDAVPIVANPTVVPGRAIGLLAMFAEQLAEGEGESSPQTVEFVAGIGYEAGRRVQLELGPDHEFGDELNDAFEAFADFPAPAIDRLVVAAAYSMLDEADSMRWQSTDDAAVKELLQGDLSEVPGALARRFDLDHETAATLVETLNESGELSVYLMLGSMLAATERWFSDVNRVAAFAHELVESLEVGMEVNANVMVASIGLLNGAASIKDEEANRFA